MLIEPVHKVNVTKQVFDKMLDLIYDNQWSPGDRLPSESELCELFGVSRITIRQAIQKLLALDLVETHHGAGSFVKAISPGAGMNALMPDIYLRGDTDSLLEVLEYREIVEVQSCRLATLRSQPDDLQLLRETVAEMERTMTADDQEGFAQADMDFHLQIATMAHNSIILKIHEILGAMLKRAMQDTITKMGYLGLWYHQQILAAMEQGDADKAAGLMAEHLANGRRFLMAGSNPPPGQTGK